MRMGVRVSVLIGAITLMAAACGGSDGPSGFGPPGGDDGGLYGDGGGDNNDGGGFTQPDGSHPPTGCKPTTCAEEHATCGPVGDGCGGLIQCGDCTTPGETCGGGGNHSVCGGGNKCTPKTAADLPAGTCGPQSDGCGGLIEGATCTPPQTCGGGGTASVCGGSGGCDPTLALFHC